MCTRLFNICRKDKPPKQRDEFHIGETLKRKEDAKNPITLGYKRLEFPRNSYTKEYPPDSLKQFSVRVEKWGKGDCKWHHVTQQNEAWSFHHMLNTAIPNGQRGTRLSVECAHQLPPSFLPEAVPEEVFFPLLCHKPSHLCITVIPPGV